MSHASNETEANAVTLARGLLAHFGLVGMAAAAEAHRRSQELFAELVFVAFQFLEKENTAQGVTWLNKFRWADFGVDNVGRRLLTAKFLERSVPLPECLRQWLVDDLRALANHDLRRPKLYRITMPKLYRDDHIWGAVEIIHKFFHIAPTRNYARRQHPNAAHSACSIVAQALSDNGVNLTEDAVEKIWRARRLAPAPKLPRFPNEVLESGRLSWAHRALRLPPIAIAAHSSEK